MIPVALVTGILFLIWLVLGWRESGIVAIAIPACQLLPMPAIETCGARASLAAARVADSVSPVSGLTKSGAICASGRARRRIARSRLLVV